MIDDSQPAAASGGTAVRRRLWRGMVANVSTLVTRIVVQLATLPLLFAVWPAEKVGSWLALFAIPSYIALLGNGFAGAGGSAALAAANAGDMARARTDFRAAWAISLVGTVAIGALFLLARPLVSSALAGGLAGIEPDQLDAAFAWLALYVLAVSQVQVLEIAFRIAGRYPDAVLISSIAAIVDLAIIAAVVLGGGGIAALAMALAGGRAAIFLAALSIARRGAPALFASGGGNLRTSLAAILAPSLAFMLMPLVYALNLQGYLLMVGAAYGGLMLASFAATRTLVRLLDLVASLSFAMQYYEAGYLGEERLAIERRLLATNTLVMILVSLAFAVPLLALGHWIQALYTRGTTVFDTGVAAVLLGAAFLRCLAATPTALISADNRHQRIVASYLAGSVIGLALAVMLARTGFPLAVAMLPLLLAEAAQTLPALAAALRRVGLAPREFIAMLASPARFHDLRDLAQALLHRG